jgi:hypothetical protein
MSMPRKKKLPSDILRVLVEYIPSNSDLISLGLACGKATIHSLQAVWKCPRPNSLEAVEKLTHIVQLSSESKTCNKGSQHLPYYYAWITGFDFSALDQESAAQVKTADLSILFTTPSLPFDTLNTSQLLALPPALVERQIQSLKELNMSSCTQYSSAALIQILTRSSSSSILTTLDLSNCSVDDAVIIQISRTHTRLRRINLQHSGNISDSAILALADHCPELEDLIISLPHGIVQSNKITDKSLKILAQSCSRMKVVVCRGQTRISEQTTLAFQKYCPLLVTYDFSTEQKPNIY